MKQPVKKLQLKKRTLVLLAQEEQYMVNGGASITCFTIRICPTPPETLNCPTTY